MPRKKVHVRKYQRKTGPVREHERGMEVSNVPAMSTATKFKPYVVSEYNPGDLAEDEVRYLREEYPEKYSEMSDEEIYAEVWENSDLYESAWEFMKDELSDAMEEIGEGRDEDNNYWYASGQRLGWQNRTGEKEFAADDGFDMLENILPDTSDLSLKIERIAPKELKITVWHHDSPTGEFYFIEPMSDADWKRDYWEE